MEQLDRIPWLPYCGLVVAASIYGGWALIAKAAMAEGAPPFVFAFYRCAGGTAVLSLAVFFTPGLLPEKGIAGMSKRDASRFAVLGVAMGANICGLLLAASFGISGLTISIFQPSIPVVTAILSAVWGIEDISRLKICSILLSVAGAIIVVLFGDHTHGGNSQENHIFFGTGSLVFQVSCTALYFVLSKDVLKMYPPVFVTAVSYGVAAMFCFVIALAKHGLDFDIWMMRYSRTAWLCATYAVILATAVNWSILAWANKKTSPTAAACSTPMQPMAAALFSWLILGVNLTSSQALGGLAITIGLLMYIKAQAEEQESKSLVPEATGKKASV